MLATMNHGIVRRGVEYKVLATGYKCTCVSARGKAVWVPDYVFDPSNDRFYREQEQEENSEYDN